MIEKKILLILLCTVGVGLGFGWGNVMKDVVLKMSDYMEVFAVAVLFAWVGYARATYHILRTSTKNGDTYTGNRLDVISHLVLITAKMKLLLIGLVVVKWWLSV